MNVLESFIEKINVVGEQQIPVHVIHRAKLALLDYIGVTLAGRREQSNKLMRLIGSFASKGEKYIPLVCLLR